MYEYFEIECTSKRSKKKKIIFIQTIRINNKRNGFEAECRRRGQRFVGAWRE